ncbi:KTSC domain-containing protein [Collimonas humicola]|uniref:KTSC domain-containing protein n=1 Tax=Collimonas humicola TaxID=2825886 RepID=UPI001B8BDE41|nr:KTSC domain-containing protein [Collimonas humicola]
MEMKRINAGKLRAIGYEPRERTLRVELDDGSVIDYSGVGNEVWRRLSTSGAAWSYYRDNIEEEFSSRRGVARTQKKSNPLDELFKAAGDDAGS